MKIAPIIIKKIKNIITIFIFVVKNRFLTCSMYFLYFSPNTGNNIFFSSYKVSNAKTRANNIIKVIPISELIIKKNESMIKKNLAVIGCLTFA